MKFFYGAGGALVCDEPIEGVTQELDPRAAAFYGGRYFIGESIRESAAQRLSDMFGGELVQDPLYIGQR